MDGPALSVPLSVWDFVLTWVPRICTCLGALVGIVWWKTGRLPGFGQQKGEGRRIDDKLLDRVLTSQENLAKALNNLADSWREQGRCMCDEMRNQTTSIVQTLATGLRDVHGRIDVLVGKQGHKEAHHGAVKG